MNNDVQPTEEGIIFSQQMELNPLEMWVGIECTVNRVGENYFDQLKLNGHDKRIRDLDMIAELGVKALRYPILWEKVAPKSFDELHWRWSDNRIKRLLSLGIKPIVGLVHHGSGPKYTSLIDPEFGDKLAKYARLVAERYPHLEYYTPVNEPLTTARFSGLYGLWYPHGQDNKTFATALLNECKATALAMFAIREINPDAKLAQTDDLGKTFSTPKLKYQADFENERRWITWDLLCGKIDPAHPMWHYLLWCGADKSELQWFLDHPCPPDIIGINHYLTSERYIDHRLSRYPEHTHGGNGRDRYADVEAVRALSKGITGTENLLMEAWERYQIPLAITEAHLGCTREEQVRWLLDVWKGAQQAKANGADVRAVTAWSLLGAYNWHCLLTRCEGHYEPGAFDVRNGTPRPTALAHAIKSLAHGEQPSDAVLQAPGWWRRTIRFVYKPVHTYQKPIKPISDGYSQWEKKAQPILICGSGTLGRAFARLCQLRGIPHRLLSRADLDVANPERVEQCLQEMRPWAVINTAGYVRVDEAEKDRERCHRENTIGAVTLAAECGNKKLPLVTFSSDLVFDGQKGQPYVESDTPSPLCVYGITKAEAEQLVMLNHPEALVIRTSAFFGPWDEANFVTIALRELAKGQPFKAAVDQVVSPTYVPDLVNATLDLLIDHERGIWHLANTGAVTWHEFALLSAEMMKVKSDRLIGIPSDDLGLTAPRPAFSALNTKHSIILPTLENALSRYRDECEFSSSFLA